MRLVSTIIVAILPLTLGLPLHDQETGDALFKDVIQLDRDASSDAAAAIDADRLIAIRNGVKISPLNLGLYSGGNPQDTSGEVLQTVSSVAAHGARLASKVKRGIIIPTIAGLLPGDDPLGGILGFLGLDSLLGGSRGDSSGDSSGDSNDEAPGAAPSAAAPSAAAPSEDCTNT